MDQVSGRTEAGQMVAVIGPRYLFVGVVTFHQRRAALKYPINLFDIVYNFVTFISAVLEKLRSSMPWPREYDRLPVPFALMGSTHRAILSIEYPATCLNSTLCPLHSLSRNTLRSR